MKDKIIIDLRKIMDEFFDSAQSFGEAVQDGFKGHSFKDGDDFFWDEKIDYYPAYSYPPANVYLKEDKSIDFEFAEDKFDREKVKAIFKNGVLKVEIPAKAEFTTKEGIKIEIVKEEEE